MNENIEKVCTLISKNDRLSIGEIWEIIRVNKADFAGAEHVKNLLKSGPEKQVFNYF